MNTNDNIKAYVVRELGLEALPEKERDEAVSKVGEAIAQNIAVALFEKLPEDKHEEYTRIVESGDQQAIAAFFKASVPDADTIIPEVLKKSINEFKDIRDSVGS